MEFEEYEDWFRSYLAYRRQKLKWKHLIQVEIFYSDWCTIKQRVPLGSIHGPLLFIIFIYDLPLRINSISEPILFADDTSVIISSKHYEDFCSVSNLVLLLTYSMVQSPSWEANWFAAGQETHRISRNPNLVLLHMIKWFAANNLVLNLDHMNIMKFITKNSAHSTLHIGYKEKYIEETVNTNWFTNWRPYQLKDPYSGSD